MTTRRSHQDGYVFRRGKWWVIRYRIRTADGGWKHKAETVRSTMKSDASNLLDQRLRSVNAGAVLPLPIRFSDFVKNQWANYIAERWKASTQATMGSFVANHLVPYFGHFWLSDISPGHIQEFMAAKRRDGLKDKTRLHLWSLLERMFNVAIELELLSAGPMRKEISKPHPQRTEKPTLDAAQVTAVLKAIAIRYRGLAILVALTGVRLGEALGLQWQDVDFITGKLHFRRGIWRGRVQTPKSTASVRTKHLTPALEAVLRAQHERSFYTGSDDFVFASTRGTPLNPDNCRVALSNAIKAAGIQKAERERAYGFHLLRHTAGSLMYELTGGDLKQTSSYMGHSSVGITADTYIHLAADSQLAAARRLEQTLCTAELLAGLCSNRAQPGEVVN